MYQIQRACGPLPLQLHGGKSYEIYIYLLKNYGHSTIFLDNVWRLSK